MVDTNISFRVKKAARSVAFEQLLPRCLFMRPNWMQPERLWMKINKGTAQALDEASVYLQLEKNEEVLEVILVRS